jgi:GT2 family glycosyltransferase
VPDLSIVIPTFDTASMTLRCCRSVLASKPASAEVIVVDDGSVDGTADLLAREVPEVEVVRLESNHGFAGAANRGVAVARGSIILLLNSDALIEQSGQANALHSLLTAFDSEPALGVAGAQLVNEDGTLQWSGGPTPTLLWLVGVVSGAGQLARFFRARTQPQGNREVDWVSGAAMAFRRRVWSDAGPLDERFRFYCQDLAFCLRARGAGWRVRVVPEARVIHQIGGTIAGGSALRHDPERLWGDLMAWGSSYYRSPWPFFARFVLTCVAWLRIGWRVLRSPLRCDDTTNALMRAARSLRKGEE